MCGADLLVGFHLSGDVFLDPAGLAHRGQRSAPPRQPLRRKPARPAALRPTDGSVEQFILV
jgi:hypothetical protein